MAGRPGRVTGKAARRSKWYTKPRNQWIAGGVVLAVLGAGGVALAVRGSDPPGETAADRWKKDVVADFSEMSQGAVGYLQTVNDWRSGKAAEKNVDAAADLALTQFLVTREHLAARAPFGPAPRALPDYRDSVEIYIAHARLAKLGAALTGKGDAKLQNQIELIMGRVRYVGDRLFDLGADELDKFTTQAVDVPGFEYARAVDVPSFAGTDLAPGPPLAQARPGVPLNREYQKVRPEGSFAGWQAAVEAAKIPAVRAEVQAISGGSVEDLNALAEQLTAASDSLYAAPDPQGERELSTRVQLGLLTQAEALRAAQVSRLVPAGLKAEAVEITQVLALVGNGMWDDRLGARDPGYPRTLLTERPAVAPPPLPDVPLPDVPPTSGPAPGASTGPTPVRSPA
ncbi:MAG TPA: hypothetical protein VMZ00_15300 [Sporichthya sp.]|nr:hypothetical protein [Sporichthya sp.]